VAAQAKMYHYVDISGMLGFTSEMYFSLLFIKQAVSIAATQLLITVLSLFGN